MVRWRINFILFLFFLSGMVIIGQLFYIQVVKGDHYKALVQGWQYAVEKEAAMERGEIFLKDGEPLAVNASWPLIISMPVEVEEKEATAEKLAEILSLDKDFILAKLAKDSLYEVIKKKLTDEESRKIEELNLKGIYLKKESNRYYPQEAFASQLVGFVDADWQGQYGLESYYNEILKGKKDQKGQDIFLTVDYAVQFKAEKLLEQAKENLDIEGGEIIVMDPNSGEILVLANFPNFNPNQYSTVTDFEIFKNGATQKIFEPGSVFKPITMAAALNEEKITPQTSYLDKGTVKIGGWPITNYDNRVYGEQTMTNVLEKSINTGAVFAEEKLGHSSFLQYLDEFGFFRMSGIDLPEIYSENKEFKKGYEINFATASFGQGIEITPIQLVKAFAAIANGGKLVKPHLVKEAAGSSQTEEENQVISSKTSAQLTSMLVSVVENGFAKSAGINGYYVAGKTGTAQISFAALEIDKKGYSDKTWQSFIGFVPAFNPRFVILVKLNNPKARTAEYSAVPIFRDLAKYLIDYYQIPPDHE